MAAKAAKPLANHYPQKVMAILSGSSDPERTRRRLALMLPKLEAAGVPVPESATAWLEAHPAPEAPEVAVEVEVAGSAPGTFD